MTKKDEEGEREREREFLKEIEREKRLTKIDEVIEIYKLIEREGEREIHTQCLRQREFETERV